MYQLLDENCFKVQVFWHKYLDLSPHRISEFLYELFNSNGKCFFFDLLPICPLLIEIHFLTIVTGNTEGDYKSFLSFAFSFITGCAIMYQWTISYYSLITSVTKDLVNYLVSNSS